MPPLKDLGKYGCSIDAIGHGKQARWHVHVWAEHKGDRDWNRLYAIREKRKQAFKDCAEWLEKMDRATAPPKAK